MRMNSRRILCHAMALIALLAGSGCVKRMPAVTPDQTEASAFARLRSVTVAPDASRVEIVSDQPLTYTSYKAGEPAKIVVDISQTEPGPVATPIEVNRGSIRRIELIRQPVGGGVLTRAEIALTRDVDFTTATDPSDKTRLVVTLLPVEQQIKAPEFEAKPYQAALKDAPAAGDAKEAPLAEGRIEEKNLAPEIPPPPAAKSEAAAGKNRVHLADAAAPAAPEAPRDQPRKAADAGAPRRLNAIVKAPDGIDLSIEGGVETFNSFRLKKPDRIVLDIFGMKSALTKNVVPIGSFGVADARVGTTPDKLRIVLDAADTTLPPFDVVKSDLGLKIRLKPEGAAQGGAPAPVAKAHAPRAVRPLPAEPPVPAPSEVKREAAPAHLGKGALESLDFKIVDGFSRITLKLYGTCEPGQPVHGAQGISLSIRNCQIPKELQRALDTSRFGSPVISVTPYQVKAKGAPVAKLLVRLKGNPPFTMNRKGDLLVLDVANPGPVTPPQLPAAPRLKPAPAEPAMAEELAPAAPKGEDVVTEIPSNRPAKKAYHGRRVTLEFSDADIRKIFQLIAEVSNLNFLISDDVQGTITIKLVNVPWDQALDVILDAKGLGMQREGNIVQIKPKTKIATQADEEQAAKRAAERVMELRTAVFEVNYAAVGEVANQFAALKSERGTITRDERTSRVIVKDVQPALDDMRQLLKTLDAPEKQVMIEARIVEATSSFTRDLGVQWGLHYKDGSASFAGINTVDTGFGGAVSSAGPGSSGAGGIGLGMSFGKLTSNVQLDMRLAAAATIGQVKIISTPKVVTLNNKAAKISQGQSIPYQTTSAEGTKTEFVEAALTLEVTPHITADGAVSMKIKASNNSPGAGSPPPINKKEATTELVVTNGETTVIGGIYVDSDTETDTGIPFLSDIPLLGWMFKSNAKQKTKTELLIFITPKVVI
jgi:type IV pilus assembly protein PilQ